MNYNFKMRLKFGLIEFNNTVNTYYQLNLAKLYDT